MTETFRAASSGNTRGLRPASRSRKRARLQRLVAAAVRLFEPHSSAELHELLIDEVLALTSASRALLVLDAPDGLHLAIARLPKGEWAPGLLKAVTPWLDEARRDRAVHLHCGPEGATEADQRSCLVAPLVAGDQLLGFIYADIDGAFGRFDDTDRKSVV